jgi:serine/threonine-protein kinase PRP4
LSDEPEVINLTDTETEYDSLSESENLNTNICNHLLIDKENIDNPIIAVSDMGSCIDLSRNNKPTSVHTKYYRAPEIILGLEYNGGCDVWALGCTIYELLTGKILFNPDKYDDIDEKRYILNDIYSKLGVIPDNIIDSSPLKQVFYTHNNIIKPITFSPNNTAVLNIWIHLISIIKSENMSSKKYLIVDLLLNMLQTNKLKRITINNALKYEIFC